jgi:hypothetical protein
LAAAVTTINNENNTLRRRPLLSPLAYRGLMQNICHLGAPRDKTPGRCSFFVYKKAAALPGPSKSLL